MTQWSRTRWLLLGGSLFYAINSLLPFWNRLCVPGFAGFEGGCLSFSLWHNVGFFAGGFAALILVMEILEVTRAKVPTGTAATRQLLEAVLTLGVLLFTLMKIIVDAESLSWGAGLGLILALVIAYGGYRRWREVNATT
jgi:hypothetical protein